MDSKKIVIVLSIVVSVIFSIIWAMQILSIIVQSNGAPLDPVLAGFIFVMLLAASAPWLLSLLSFKFDFSKWQFDVDLLWLAIVIIAIFLTLILPLLNGIFRAV